MSGLEIQGMQPWMSAMDASTGKRSAGDFGASSHTWLQDQIDHPAEKQQWEASITKTFLLSDSSGSSWSVCLLVYAFWAPFFWFNFMWRT